MRGLDRYELGALALTAGYNAAVNRHLPTSSHIPANVAMSTTLVGLARRAGLRPSDLGLSVETVGPGLRSGAVVAGIAVAGIAIGSTLPVTRQFFVDDRLAEHSRARLAYEALVRIPFATALGEELVFRGVLLGLFGRDRSRPSAIAITSALFGLWHVLPALADPQREPPGHPSRRGHRAATVVGVVGLTAAAGVGFARLRLRTGSVLAPALAHAALNASALVAAHRASVGIRERRDAGQ